MLLRMMVYLLCGGLCLAALAADLNIPSLQWTERSDWVNVKTAGVVGDGVGDDTAAIQKVLDGVKDGMVIYFPAGTYRITTTLLMQAKTRLIGIDLIGNGRDSRLVWDGPVGMPQLVENGAANYHIDGLTFDGAGKATVGLYHNRDQGKFETEVGQRNLAFYNFTEVGILADKSPATAETMTENCLFDHCKCGMAFLAFNDYDYTIDGCEFRHCETAIRCSHGNTYVRNCHFEASSTVDLALNPEHGSSVRRCTSVGSRAFISFNNGVAPLSIQDCQVSGWTNPDGAILLSGAPVALFDCVFTSPPGKTPPVKLNYGGQRLVASQNVSAATDGVYMPGTGKVYEVPAGKRSRTLTSATQHFLRDTAKIPGEIFDAKRDFGAKGDRKTDDTDAIQQAIDAARAHGKGALAYLPTGSYLISKPLRITGADYYVGGTGFRTCLIWTGAEGGNIMEVQDPQHVTLERLNVGSHDAGNNMKNACDILQTGTAKSSFMTYDGVTVYGMYDRQPFRKGLWLRELGHGATVLVRHVEGNIHLVDAARATVLLGNSYEGSVVVEGKAKERDGFLGIITRLGTSCTFGLYVKDNHSLVGSDFYIEQADNAYSLEGSPDDPPGRITLSAPKLHIGTLKDPTQNMAFSIQGYHGQINYGPAQFYIEPLNMKLTQTGQRPLDILFWANSFYNTKLAVQKEDSAHIAMVGCTGTSSNLEGVQVEETLSPDTLSKLSIALDDLRELGELDMRLNHAEVGR